MVELGVLLRMAAGIAGVRGRGVAAVTHDDTTSVDHAEECIVVVEKPRLGLAKTKLLDQEQASDRLR